MMAVLDDLAGLTYMVRHNPNCQYPFEVRLTGMGLLATLSWHGTISRQYGRGRPIDTDDTGYGLTLEEAARAALAAKEYRLDAPIRRAQKTLLRELWSGL